MRRLIFVCGVCFFGFAFGMEKELKDIGDIEGAAFKGVKVALEQKDYNRYKYLLGVALKEKLSSDELLEVWEKVVALERVDYIKFGLNSLPNALSLVKGNIRFYWLKNPKDFFYKCLLIDFLFSLYQASLKGNQAFVKHAILGDAFSDKFNKDLVLIHKAVEKFCENLLSLGAKDIIYLIILYKNLRDWDVLDFIGFFDETKGVQAIKERLKQDTYDGVSKVVKEIADNDHGLFIRMLFALVQKKDRPDSSWRKVVDEAYEKYSFNESEKFKQVVCMIKKLSKYFYDNPNQNIMFVDTKKQKLVDCMIKTYEY